ncbi:MAG: hypothetical protein FWC78_05855 [Defluviitaleaceae bacterium]|nr:hypothetical protein [Defluviitaleaceae bacterium]
MIFLLELKKILSMAALWSFVALCFAFNIWAIPSNLRNVDFDTTTPFPENIFDGYSASETADVYIAMFNLSDRVADRMAIKHEALQAAANERAAEGASFSPYLGELTQVMHLNLFHGVAGVLGRLLFQGMLLAALVALLAIGYERASNTEHSIYTTKKGRGLLRSKIAAGLVAGVGLYILLAAATLAVYFVMFDYGAVWGNNVSSGFNYVIDIIGARPFITWRSFTVASYLGASIGLGLLLVVCFSLMGASVAVFSKNGYMGFLALLLINALFLAAPLAIPMNTYSYFASFYSPIWLWWNSHLWFTDGGITTLWRHFELWGTGFSFLALAVTCLFAVKKFEKRDIQ